jgi:plasmid stabilization system protein ParE
MSHTLILLPAAARELDEAQRWHAEHGTADAFLADIGAAIEQIELLPLRFPIVYAKIRRALTRRFHYSIFFEIFDASSQLVVEAVLHQRRDPRHWPRR